MVKKIENRNIDVTKARGELEEDLLEYVYRTWRQGRQITSKEYAREVNITGYEAAGLVRSLVKKGFLCEALPLQDFTIEGNRTHCPV